MGNKKISAIVIGTSAGGLEALTILLKPLPEGYAPPILLVQHRAREAGDLFEEVLQRRIRLKVKQADEKEVIEAGRVYVAPPDYHLLVEGDGTLSLSCEAPVHFSRPAIDVLFESAAFTFGEALAAIVLTGSNDDGAEGIVAVKRMGGMTIVQDPIEAQYPFMPRAAIATGAVDYVWTLAKMGEFLRGMTNDE